MGTVIDLFEHLKTAATVRVTPDNLMAVADLLKANKIEVYTDGWGYLCAKPFTPPPG